MPQIEMKETKKADDLHPIDQPPFWHTPFKAFVSSTTAGYICYIGESYKKKAQSGQPLPYPWEFKRVYRGANAFALPLAPVSMVQMSVDTQIKKLLPENASEFVKNSAVAFSGSLGALVSAPVEHTILTQQKRACGPIQAMKFLISQGYTTPWTALRPLMVREAGFGAVYLSFAEQGGKWLAENYQHAYPSIDLMTVGKLGTGILGAYLTHPADTIGTRMQNSVTFSNKKISIREAAKQIYHEKNKKTGEPLGLKGFYAGAMFRGFWLFPGCALIIDGLSKKLDKELKEREKVKKFASTQTKGTLFNPATKIDDKSAAAEIETHKPSVPEPRNRN